MIDLYVYYKVRDEDAARLLPIAHRLQARGAPGGARLMRRPGSQDGIQTWMEVYPGVSEAFPAALEQAAGEAGFDGLIVGPRRAEVFVELSPCA